MRHAFLIAKKELFSFFVSPVSYLVAGAFFFINFLFFYLYIRVFRGDFELTTQFFFTWDGFWWLAFFVPPVLTMRLVSDEFRLGTVEMLMTAPSSDSGVIFGKFFAAFGFSLILWLTTPALFLVAQMYGATFDWGIVCSGYLGVTLIYALFCSVGIFTSTLTESPVLSMLVAVVIELALFFFVLLLPRMTSATWAESIAQNYSIYQILGDSLVKGIVSSTHILFLGSLTWLFLFLATRCLEFRRWR